ncbi:MAG: GWxTD domain-containing protein [Candidatus Aminicenantaceae bacterium]
MRAPHTLIPALFWLVSFVLLNRCGMLVGPKLDPVSQEFYDYARLIMTREESDIFRHLPDPETRAEFITDFWVKRDPDPRTDRNEFQLDFYQRIADANRFFRSEGIPGWKTDRGRIYIYLGQPNQIEQRPFMRDPEIKGLIWWGYFDYKFGVWFADRKGDGQYLIYEYSSGSGESLYQVLQRVQQDQIRRIGENFGSRNVDFDLKYDLEESTFTLTIPLEEMVFLEEGGYLKADLTFEFYVYRRRISWQHKFQETRRFEKPQREAVLLENLVFTFPLRLSNGDYYVDVVLTGDRGIGKTRRVFHVKVF